MDKLKTQNKRKGFMSAVHSALTLTAWGGGGGLCTESAPSFLHQSSYATFCAKSVADRVKIPQTPNGGGGIIFAEWEMWKTG
jgi:hypothetical protein